MNPVNGIEPHVKPSGTGCAQCEQTEGWWLHLRRCADCGNVGCCDNSPSQHATEHARTNGHPIIQSFEPGEMWFWSYDSNKFLNGPILAAPQHHPEAQSVPGPSGRVPLNWEAQLN